MNVKICKMLGIEFPLFAFSHCRDVVVEVSKAGGMGVFGAVYHTPEELEQELKWIDAHVDGKPYGVDIVVPENMVSEGTENATVRQMLNQIPESHRNFVEEILDSHNIKLDDASPDAVLNAAKVVGLMPDVGEKMMDVCFNHPIKFIAHALGVPPKSMIERARKHNIPVGALVGSSKHAIRQVEAGVDVIIAQGTEAGGHCGEVSTMVLVPEVVEAVKQFGDVPVLAAGGIVKGRQMAAAMAMGAQGAWTGSVWLPTVESELDDIMRNKLIEAGSRDTVRTKASTGKMCRQLRSSWTDAWDNPDAPMPLQMPFQPLMTNEVMRSARKSAIAGNPKAKSLLNYLVGQGIGMVTEVSSSRSVVQAFMEDFLDAVETMNGIVAE